MNLDVFLDGIGLMEEAKKQVLSWKLPEQEYEQYKKLLWQKGTEFITEMERQQEDGRLLLYLYTRLACEAWELYREKEIPEVIYWDTFSDLTIWCKVYKRDYGIYGIREYDWLWRHLRLQLFRLGRLQFEWFPLPEEITAKEIHADKDEVVLNVHIPEGCPLDREACEDSFRQAILFFGHVSVFVCHSWLLYPGLRNALPPRSNIIKFQEFFEVYKVDEESREAEERVFLYKQDDPEEYPEQTVLQKALRQELIKGKKFGSGFGILKWEER